MATQQGIHGQHKLDSVDRGSYGNPIQIWKKHMCTCVCVCVYESVCASVSLCILLGCRCPWKQGEQLMGVLRTEPWFSERVGKGS